MKKIPEILNSLFYSQLLRRLGEPIENLFLNVALADITAMYARDLIANAFLEEIPEINVSTLIFTVYSGKWNRIYQALFAQYNPIHNYDLNESGESFRKIAGESENYSNVNDAKSGTEKTISANGSNTSAGKVIDNISVDENGVSFEYQNGDNVKISNYVTTYNSETENLTGSEQSQGQSSNMTTLQDLHVYNITNSKNGEIQRNYMELNMSLHSPNSNVDINPTEFTGNNLKRSGNIGVTTTQRMIVDEIALRYQYQLANIIIRDCIDFCSGGVWA